jgi:hypothetical protein
MVKKTQRELETECRPIIEELDQILHKKLPPGGNANIERAFTLLGMLRGALLVEEK